MVPEKSLYRPILMDFRQENYDLFEEFPPVQSPNNSKKIDLVFKDRDKNHLIAIEVKMSDWKRALKQALLNTTYCHYSYIAMPKRTVAILNKEIFKESGIGVIAVHEDNCKVVVKPKFSRSTPMVKKCSYTFDLMHKKRTLPKR